MGIGYKPGSNPTTLGSTTTPKCINRDSVSHPALQKSSSSSFRFYSSSRSIPPTPVANPKGGIEAITHQKRVPHMMGTSILPPLVEVEARGSTQKKVPSEKGRPFLGFEIHEDFAVSHTSTELAQMLGPAHA
ncbi:hypothetical protein Tco_1081897 [Tanacetum coccineum]|uniref:Uncharacterized protein n=1 Tax=Tanacetum coccineum TaxID=301880 RepID=A0ABQ5I0Z4_9ASTR